MIQQGEPAADIVEMCERSAHGYATRAAHSPFAEAHNREMVGLLTTVADQYRVAEATARRAGVP